MLLSIPLMLRWVPRNRFYGFRVAPTLRSDGVWYESNAASGRQLCLLGLLMVGLESPPGFNSDIAPRRAHCGQAVSAPRNDQVPSQGQQTCARQPLTATI